MKVVYHAIFYILTKFRIFWTSDLFVVKKWKRVAIVGWLFGCGFRENSGTGCKSDLYVICVCLDEYVFWGGHVWIGGAPLDHS